MNHPNTFVGQQKQQYVATEYIEMELGTRPRHKFEAYTVGAPEVMALPAESNQEDSLK